LFPSLFSAGLDIGPLTDDSSLTPDQAGGSGRGHRVGQDEHLDAILSPELDKMVSDGELKHGWVNVFVSVCMYVIIELLFN
jgi:hypothetical protein